MKLLVPFAVVGLFLGTAVVHPQPYDRGPEPPRGYGPSPVEAPPADLPAAELPVLRRMICVIDTPFPGHRQTCPTHAGYPGSPCRCAGSFFDGERTVLD